MTEKLWTDPLRLLYLDLHPDLHHLPAYRDLDREMVEALRQLNWFTHVILVLPGYDEWPHVTDSDLMVQAVHIIQQKGGSWILGRRLWPMWQQPYPGSFVNAWHIGATLERLRKEKDHLSAIAAHAAPVGTFLDCELNGGVAKKVLKNRQYDADLQIELRDAINWATAKEGKVDLVYPCSSSRADSINWAFGELAEGKGRVDSKLYYERDSAAKYKGNPPPWAAHFSASVEPDNYAITLKDAGPKHVWASSVCLEKHWTAEQKAGTAPTKPLSVQEVKKLGEAVRRMFVYIPREWFAETVVEF